MSSEADAAGTSKLPVWTHLPFLIIAIATGPAYGYYSYDHLVTGFEFIAYLPLAVFLWGLCFSVSALLLARRAPKGRRGSVILFHFIVALFVTALSAMVLPPAGERIWEQVVLKSRREAMIEFARGKSSSPQSPFEITGYRFEMAERTSQGAMFYTVMAGGPFVSSGIYVSLSPEYRGFRHPQEGEPSSARSVGPTSVPGLFRFVTRD